MKLRQYQDDLIAEVKNCIRERKRSILLRSPTGSGKTALTAHMLNGAAEKGNQSWFIVHRRELVKQSVETFKEMGVQVGIIGAGFSQDLTAPIQICSIQTLSNRITKLPVPQLVVWDECHHAAAASWLKVREGADKAVHIGLSATPERQDGKGLRNLFGVMVHGPETQWLIKEGFLSDYKLYNSNPPDMRDVKHKGSDFDRDEASKIMRQPKITGDAISHYMKYARGKRAIVFHVNIADSKMVAEKFNEAGVPALHVDGETPEQERDDAIEKFRRGEILVLSNCELFGEGFDLPSIECAILLRPTESLGLYLQQVGRALRPVYAPGFDLESREGRLAAIAAGGKPNAIILDHAGNSERHGMPCEIREWSLDGKKGRKRKGDDGPVVRVKNCTHCSLANEIARRECKWCKMPFEVNGREVAHVDGELREVSVDEARAAHHARTQRWREEDACKTENDFYVLGRSRKYPKARGWAQHKMTARLKKAAAR